MIALEGVSKRFGDGFAVRDLTLTVSEGELLVLVGESGCGKTTTLKMINRLVEPSAGTISIGGEDTASLPGHVLRRRIGYGFQQVGLFPHWTVAENIAVAPRLCGWPEADIPERIDALLALVRLDPVAFRDRDPATLSGGQRQRVGLARALAANPRVLLLDEPFGALDPATRDHLQQELLRIREALNLTTVFVTHDVSEALLLGDRIAVLAAGRLVRVGSPRALLADPGDPLVEALLATPRRQLDRIETLLATAPGDE